MRRSYQSILAISPTLDFESKSNKIHKLVRKTPQTKPNLDLVFQTSGIGKLGNSISTSDALKDALSLEN